jgi:hypothetical protein
MRERSRKVPEDLGGQRFQSTSDEVDVTGRLVMKRGRELRLRWLSQAGRQLRNLRRVKSRDSYSMPRNCSLAAAVFSFIAKTKKKPPLSN